MYITSGNISLLNISTNLWHIQNESTDVPPRNIIEFYGKAENDGAKSGYHEK